MPRAVKARIARARLRTAAAALITGPIASNAAHSAALRAKIGQRKRADMIRRKRRDGQNVTNGQNGQNVRSLLIVRANTRRALQVAGVTRRARRIAVLKIADRVRIARATSVRASTHRAAIRAAPTASVLSAMNVQSGQNVQNVRV